MSVRVRIPAPLRAVTSGESEVTVGASSVDQALTEVSQGKPVSVTTSRAYGCSVKYSS